MMNARSGAAAVQAEEPAAADEPKIDPKTNPAEVN